jgi:hypothetical protein
MKELMSLSVADAFYVASKCHEGCCVNNDGSGIVGGYTRQTPRSRVFAPFFLISYYSADLPVASFTLTWSLLTILGSW